MKIYCINNTFDKSPNDYCDDFSEFSDYDLSKLKDSGVEEIWYWYAEGDYCGNGALIARIGNEYSLHECDHCSCYGPLEEFEFYGREFSKLRKSMSKEAYDLFARKHTGKSYEEFGKLLSYNILWNKPVN